MQGSLPAGRLTFTGRESNPLDHYERFQLVLTIIPLSCSPDATTLHSLRCGGIRICARVPDAFAPQPVLQAIEIEVDDRRSVECQQLAERQSARHGVSRPAAL